MLNGVRYAPSYDFPELDSSSQVSSVTGGLVDGRINIAFTMPCWSDDENDVSLAGKHRFLLGLGPLMGEEIQYQTPAFPEVTDEIEIDCGGKIRSCMSPF